MKNLVLLLALWFQSGIAASPAPKLPSDCPGERPGDNGEPLEICVPEDPPGLEESMPERVNATRVVTLLVLLVLVAVIGLKIF